MLEIKNSLRNVKMEHNTIEICHILQRRERMILEKSKQIFLIILVLLIASFVRLWHIESSPAWYTDEGTHIEIARQLISGKVQYLGITDSFLIAARLPLFEHLLGLWFQYVGIGMFQLRVLTSLLGIITVALVYRVVRSVSRDSLFASSAMALFAIYPQAVIYSRFGFSYNLLSVLILGGLWYLVRYQKTLRIKDLLAGGFLFGLGTVSDFISFVFLPSVVFIAVFIRPKHVLFVIVGLIMPFALYSVIEISYHPHIFLHDLTYTLSRTGGLPISLQIENLIKNVQMLMTDTWWMPLGIVGCLTIPGRSFRWMVILLLILPIVISGRTIALYNLSSYYMIPFLPFIAIGVTALFLFVVRVGSEVLSLSQQGVMLSLVTLVVAVLVIQMTVSIRSGFRLGIEHFLIKNDEAYQIQEVLLDYAKPTDVLISSPTLAWMFEASVTDYQLSSLAYRIDSVHFPATLYPDRFAFDTGYENATYAIVDNLWRDWGAVHMPYVLEMLTDIQLKWELIFEVRSLQVYKNPKA